MNLSVGDRLGPYEIVSPLGAGGMPWNVREMHVRHPDGHVFRIGQGLEE